MSKQFCLQVTNCHMPSEMGPCHRYTIRYYYNVTFEKCRPFNYSGCEGNNNNFESFLYCQDSCSEASKVHSDQLGHKCQMPKDSGTFFQCITYTFNHIYNLVHIHFM